MSKIFNSLEQLSSVSDSICKFNPDMFKPFCNGGSVRARNNSEKYFRAQKKAVLEVVDTKDFEVYSEYRSSYEEYCRILSACALITTDMEEKIQLLLNVERILELAAPEFKSKVRAVKKDLRKDGAKVKSMGFTWEDLYRFDFSDFATRYADTLIEQVVRKENVAITDSEESHCEEPSNALPQSKTVSVNHEDLRRKREESGDFGFENTHVEYKSSFVEAPANATYSNQKEEVCRKVCGFLNTDGGVLYIGVDPTTHKAYPEIIDGYYHGVARDINCHLATTTLHGRMIRDVEDYSRWVSREMYRIFKDSNKDNIDKFFNDCIVVEPTWHNNVVAIRVKPSEYHIVALKGKKYFRTADECKEMNNEQVLARMQRIKDIKKETKFEKKLREAMEAKKQVVLYRYESSSSKTISDRTVEPYAIVCNGESVMCYDVDKKAIRQFKLSRISDVRITKNDWQYEEFHGEKSVDYFGWTYTGKKYHIRMDMSLKARVTLQTYCKSMEKDVIYSIGNETWRFDAILHSLEPLRGFYMAMASEVTIAESEDSETFRQNVRNYVLSLAEVI